MRTGFGLPTPSVGWLISSPERSPPFPPSGFSRGSAPRFGEDQRVRPCGGGGDFNGEVLAGAIDSRTALRLIREWVALHRGELEENWRLAKIRQPLRQIAPLE